MKLKFQEQRIVYFLCGIVFITVFIAKIGTIHIEPIDMSYVKKILHPEYPQGSVSYDPQFHYNYIVAFVAKNFGYEYNSPGLARIFWFAEQSFTIFVLVMLSNYLFKDDKLALVLVVYTYLMLKSGETDQKTMLRPFHFLAIYYFLKEKWVFSAIFTASIFYLHIGVAIWWFVPSIFALSLVYLFKNKQVTLLQITKYAGMVIFLASPILYHYLGGLQLEESFTNNDFFVRFWYGSVYNSVLYELIFDPKTLAIRLITVSVFVVGFMKWRAAGGRNNYIVPITLGVLILYVLDFVLVDLMFNGTAIKMQLLRSILNVELFASLFFAFLITKQLKKGNLVFIAILSILLIPNPFRWEALYVFYVVVLVYEIFNQQISVAREKIYLFFDRKLILSQFKKTTIWVQHFFQSPVNLTGYFIVLTALLVTMSLSPIKPYVKSVLGIQQKTGMSKRESLQTDIARFTNEKITGDDVILIFPFGVPDFEFYTHQKVFVHAGTILDYVPKHIDKFQYIFENDLNYSIEKFKSEGSWDKMWRSVDEKLIRKWRDDYKVTHVIRENELHLDFPVVYENEHYTIYDLRLLDNSHDGHKI